MKPYCISVFQDRPVSLRSKVIAVAITGEMPHCSWCCCSDYGRDTKLRVIAVVITGEIPHCSCCCCSDYGRDATLRVVAVVITGEMPHFSENIVIIIIRHESDLDRTLSASSVRLFIGLTSRLLPFGLQFSNIFAILLLFILVTCRSQFDLYQIKLATTLLFVIWCYFQLLQNFFIPLWSKEGLPGCSSEIFHLY